VQQEQQAQEQQERMEQQASQQRRYGRRQSATFIYIIISYGVLFCISQAHTPRNATRNSDSVVDNQHAVCDVCACAVCPSTAERVLSYCSCLVLRVAECTRFITTGPKHQQSCSSRKSSALFAAHIFPASCHIHMQALFCLQIFIPCTLLCACLCRHAGMHLSMIRMPCNRQLPITCLHVLRCMPPCSGAGDARA
jgi:hypothetical protein